MVSHVSLYSCIGVNGKDTYPGTEDKPFKTITEARDTIRSIKKTSGLPNGGVQVNIHPADYGPLELTSEDSGSESCHIG